MIILYSQPSCPQCRAVHLLLDKNSIEYLEVQDIDKAIALGIERTPALDVDGRILYGKEIFNYVNGRNR